MSKVIHFEHVVIAGIAYLDATQRVTSAEIDTRLAPTLNRLPMFKGLLDNYVGIHARHYWPTGTKPSDVATQAANKLFEDLDLDPHRVGVIINASVSKDYIEPSVAAIIHGKLNLSDQCLNFDISNACMGFMNAMQIVATMIEAGQIDYGLIVAGEDSRYITEMTIQRLLQSDCNEQIFRDNFATLTLGSGAVAMVMARAELVPQGHRLIKGINLANTRYSYLCHGQVDHMYCDSVGLFNAGMGLLKRMVNYAKHEMGWEPANQDEFIFHQVNAVYTNTFAKHIGVGKDKMFVIYPEYGNIGPCTIPVSLAKAREAGNLAPGKKVSLVCIGSGINCAIFEVIW